ncbi:hypothetical protein L1887_31823 [Cichorium endivia]|nr:hypothetical protein L1887_31823 [Cichorium endivia]
MANNNYDHVPHVLVNRVSEQAVFPTEFILSSAKTITLHAHRMIEVPTDLRFTVPVGVRINLVPMPDMSQQSIEIVDNFISCGIEAPVSIGLWNHSGLDIEVKAGDEIARMDFNFSDRTSPEFIDVTPDLIND